MIVYLSSLHVLATILAGKRFNNRIELSRLAAMYGKILG
jgi:hypothetical protein